MQLLIEFISDVQKFFLNFGLYANTKRLLDTNPPKGDHLACLDGLRFISISWVMLGHILSAEMNFFPLTNIAFFTQVSIKNLFHFRLVHVLWYDILGHYFGMILQYFGMKIYYV